MKPYSTERFLRREADMPDLALLPASGLPGSPHEQLALLEPSVPAPGHEARVDGDKQATNPTGYEATLLLARHLSTVF